MELIYIALAIFLVSGLLVFAIIHARKPTPDISNIRPNDNLVFFRSSAWLDEEKMQWNIPIHGWIYIPQHSTLRKAAFRKLLESRYNLVTNESSEANFSQRFNFLLSDNKRGRVVVIWLAGRKYVLPRSKANGHFSTVLRIPSENLNKPSANKLIKFKVITSTNETRDFSGEAQLVYPKGFSIISDIDDTIKISQVKDSKQLLNNTFYKDFKDVDGMRKHYQEWSKSGASVHYVSSSPWHLYPPLLEFVDKSGFPWASFDLKHVRLKDKSIFNFFKPGTSTKPSQIEPILLRFPRRKFILFGDSGEHDPEVYSGLMKKYPQQIIKVFIRVLNKEDKSHERFRTLFKNFHSDHWELFSEPNQLPAPANKNPE